MDKSKSIMRKKKFLFHVDIQIEGYNKAMAQEALQSILRSDKFKLLKLESDTPESGQIEEQPKPIKKEHPKPILDEGYRDSLRQIEEFIKNNTLIRLSIVKEKGVKLSVPCRVLNYDDTTQIVMIYHVDEKKVYQYNMNEIDELIVG